VRAVLNYVFDSLGVVFAQRTGSVFIGEIVTSRPESGVAMVRTAVRTIFVKAAPRAMCHVLLFQRSALERVIVERGSSRRLYDEPTG